MNVALRVLLTLWGFLVAVVWSLFIGVAYLVLRPVERNGEWFDRLFSLQSRVLVRLLGIRLQVEHPERFPRDRPVLLMANHRSYLDIPALVAAFPGHSLRFVAKRSLGAIPVYGWAIAASPCVLIDRANARDSLRRIKRGAAALSPGAALAIFPEGTRAAGESLLPFKKGAFLLAAGSGLPVLPVALQGSGKVWGKTQRLFRPGTIRVRVLPLLEKPEGKVSPDRLLEDVQRSITGALEENR